MDDSKPTLAVWKFASCDGCQLSLLDCENDLLPLGRAVSPGWAEVGDFLGPSIRDFWRRFPPERLRGIWEGAGIEGVQARLQSLGGGVVMWGARGG